MEDTLIKLRPDEIESLENGYRIEVCIASDDPDEKYRVVEIAPPDAVV